MRIIRQKRFTFLAATIAPLAVVLTLGVAAAQAMRGPDPATHPPSTLIQAPVFAPVGTVALHLPPAARSREHMTPINGTAAAAASTGARTAPAPSRVAGRIAVSSRRGTLGFGRARTATSSSALAVGVGIGSAAALALIALVAAGWPRKRAEVVTLAGSNTTAADGSAPPSQDQSSETRRKAA